ncbi:MAG: flavodoxin domain-containing protein [bacterium]
MKQALILYATREGQTEKVALTIARHLAALGAQVSTHNLQDLDDTLHLEQADLLLFGASMHAGGLEKELVDFINTNASTINQRPHAFFLVLLSAATADKALREKSLHDAHNKMQQQLSVDFLDIEYIAGALPYSKYSRPVRWIMRRIAQQHGENTDISQDYEYTDWAKVKTYAEKLNNTYLTVN